MIARNFVLLAGLCASVALAACATETYPNNGQHWQRVSTSDPLLQQGLKADQMLKRDIGRCVTELKELESLGVVEDAVKTDLQGRVLDPDELKYKETLPDAKDPLIPTDRTFRNFDSCMLAKGWERMMHPPRSVYPPRRVSNP